MRTIFYRMVNIVNYINVHPLAKRHKFISYCKLIKWQLSQFISPGERIVSFTDKTFLAVKKGMTGATGNIYLGLHEFNDMGFLLHFLRPKDLFFDIGANVGAYTVLASGHCGANTICFEPISSTFKALKKNILNNKIEHLVIAKNVGLGEVEGVLTFTNDMDTVNHVVEATENLSHDLTSVSVVLADSFVFNNKFPILVKVDVEGFETCVLNGMTTILNNTNLKVIIIELNGSGNRYNFDENDIHKKLLGLKFSSYSYNPFTRKCKKIGNPGTTNTIYIRDLNFISNRIESAEKIELFSESF